MSLSIGSYVLSMTLRAAAHLYSKTSAVGGHKTVCLADVVMY